MDTGGAGRRRASRSRRRSRRKAEARRIRTAAIASLLPRFGKLEKRLAVAAVAAWAWAAFAWLAL